MFTTIRKRLATAAMVLTVFGGMAIPPARAARDSTSATPALEEYLCQARTRRQDSYLLRCVAHCRKHAGSSDAERCEEACATNHDSAVSKSGCPSEPASEVSGIDARTLGCRAALRMKDARLAACDARCERRGAGGDPEEPPAGCRRACTLKHDRAVAGLSCARVASPPGDEIFCGELHRPIAGQAAGGGCTPGVGQARNAAKATFRGLVEMPQGLVERELEVVDGLAILEGDIVVGRAEDVPRPGDIRPEGAGRTLASTRWPNGVVPYTIDPGLPSTYRVTDAIAHWQANTSIRFVPRTTETAFVTFKPGTGCSSRVGRTGGQQDITLEAGCSTGNTIHEIGHAVGLWHEQTRADRDKNLIVNWANIVDGMAFNFQTYVEQGMDGFDIGDFDWGSIMLYGSYDFSRNGLPTLTRRNGTTFSVQRTALSTGDKASVATMYPQSVAPSIVALPRGGYEVAFQANTTSLWTVGADNHGDWRLGLMARTSPSVAALAFGGYEVAFQANTGSLWTVGADNHGDWRLGMMPGTSPSIVALPGGGYEVAFQANTGRLWTVGADNHGDWGYGMMRGTSPSITALPGGGYEVAFQANTGRLWTVGADNHGDWGLGMLAGTSPSITSLASGGYEVAFQANTTSLWTVGADNHGDWGLGMMPGTSPSITRLGSSYEVAFQANTTSLWTVGADNHGAWGLGMMKRTSPSITALATGGYEVAFEANTSSLWTVGADNHGAWGLGMQIPF